MYRNSVSRAWQVRQPQQRQWQQGDQQQGQNQHQQQGCSGNRLAGLQQPEAGNFLLTSGLKHVQAQSHTSHTTAQCRTQPHATAQKHTLPRTRRFTQRGPEIPLG